MSRLPSTPYGWGCVGPLAVLAALTLLESTPLRLGNNQPGLLFVLVALGYVAAFSIAARIQWRRRNVPAADAHGGDNVIGHAAAGFPKGGLRQVPSRAMMDTIRFAGWGGGAGLGFAATLILAWNGIVNNDVWLVIGPLGGSIIGSCVAALVVWRLQPSARRTP